MIPWQGLPYNLRQVTLWIPLTNGIPMVLDQLSNSERLAIHDEGAGQMHLDRSLDAFLDMSRLSKLRLYGDKHEQEDLGRWTAAALRLLGLVDRRVLQRHKANALRTTRFSLIY